MAVQKITMRKTFQQWLLFFVIVAFTVTFGISYVFQTRSAEKNAVDRIRLNLDYVVRQIGVVENNLNSLKKDMQSDLLEKAKVLALALQDNPNALKNEAFLKNWAKASGLEEVSIIDGDGIVIASHPEKFTGLDFKDFPQTREYLPLIGAKNGVYVEDLRISYDKDGGEGNLVQFVGVSRLDTDGLVQMGYSAKRYAEALKTASVDNLARDFAIGQTGYALIVKNDEIVSAGKDGLNGKKLADLGISDFSVGHDEGTFRTIIDGVSVFCFYRHFGDYTLIGVYPVKELYSYRNTVLFWNALFYFILFSVVFVLVSALLERIVIRGIKHTNSILSRITAGDLDEKVNIRTNEEFISLSEGINATVNALKSAIAEAAARIDKELDFAREIQSSSLPCIFPPYPEKNEFDIFASMTTAKEVGGDFYDFFLLGNKGTHLGVVIADVSGKGIPAALFMMSAKTLIKNYAETGMDPADIFTNTNRELCENNEAGMFVTAFMGILEIETGKFTYVNAGHNPPLLKRAGGPFEWMKLKSGFMLGGLDGVKYQQEELTLNGDDTLFLYTDGVTEAQNKELKLFGNDRLEDVLNENRTLAPKELLKAVRADVDAYVDGAEQSDDLTMLALTYKAKTLTIPAKVDLQDVAMNFVNKELKENNASQKTIAQIDIALEEIFVNICNYAYAPAEGDATIRCSVGGTPSFATLVFKDKGKPFNPLKKPDPDITLEPQDREIGNLGIFMVKQIMDSVDYEYKNGENILTLRKTLEIDVPETVEENVAEKSAADANGVQTETVTVVDDAEGEVLVDTDASENNQ